MHRRHAVASTLAAILVAGATACGGGGGGGPDPVAEDRRAAADAAFVAAEDLESLPSCAQWRDASPRMRADAVAKMVQGARRQGDDVDPAATLEGLDGACADLPDRSSLLEAAAVMYVRERIGRPVRYD